MAPRGGQNAQKAKIEHRPNIKEGSMPQFAPFWREIWPTWRQIGFPVQAKSIKQLMQKSFKNQKKTERLNETCQNLVPGALNDTKTIRKPGGDIFANFGADKTLKKWRKKMAEVSVSLPQGDQSNPPEQINSLQGS